MFLNRKKMPKVQNKKNKIKNFKKKQIPILTHYPGMTLKKEDYYIPQDLICG